MDVSGHAIGGILSQEQDGKWKPIAFLSRTMQPAERNYEIHDKELLAIVEALTKWRQYLLDVLETFEIWMDHKNLKYFQELSSSQMVDLVFLYFTSQFYFYFVLFFHFLFLEQLRLGLRCREQSRSI